MIRQAPPSVSVVIPAFNRERTVARAIRSVLRQTYQDFEIVVVDDGSADDTGRVVAGCGDGRIRYLRHQTRRGGAAARNTGIEVSRGRYVAFLDSDDEWLPTKLERQIDVFERSAEDLGLVCTGLIRVYPGFELRCDGRLPADVVRSLLTSNSVGNTSTGMVRRRVLAEVGGFDEELTAKQEADLWLRICERFSIHVIRDCLVRTHRDTANRISLNAPDRMQARERFYRKHYHRLAQENLLGPYLRSSGRVCHGALQDPRLARQYYWAAIQVQPVDLRSYALLLASYAPGWAYQMARRCTQRTTLTVRRVVQTAAGW